MSLWLVTGGTGFVGGHLREALARQGRPARLAVRRPAPAVADDSVCVGDIGPETDWRAALRGVDTVLHLAAAAHAAGGDVRSAEACQRAGAEGTRRLAEAAAEAGVRRLVFLSSFAVYGLTHSEAPLNEETPTAPTDAYGRAKLQAERHLWEVSAARGLEVVAIRAPLVYGAGAPGSFRRLLGLVHRGLPLPLAAIRNRRSLLGAANLADLLALAASHPAAANRLFVAADGEDLSTVELMRRLARHMRRPFRAWPLPPPLLRGLARCAGKRDIYDRLFGSLTADASRARTLLAWRPPVGLDRGLEASARWYAELVRTRADARRAR